MLSIVQQNQVIQIVKDSAIYHYHWKQRGVAPAGYMKGMGVSFAHCLLDYKAGHASDIEMAKKNTGDDHKDALSWFNSIFSKAGMTNEKDGEDTLRHLFVLMLGLGMRESSGTYCDGRDITAKLKVTADTAEAGMFQMSWDIHAGSSLIQQVFNEYKLDKSDGYLPIFKEGVHCSASQFDNFGSGTGHDFQAMCKAKPIFAVKIAGIGLRNIRTHWGPINRHEAEVRPEADVMFKKIAALFNPEEIPTS